jgi:hypothetical protein
MMNVSGFTIRSKTNPQGQISVSHYMFIIQKVMSIAMNTAWAVLIPAIDASVYDFAKDKYKIKTKSNKKVLEKRLRENLNEQDFARLKVLFPKADFSGLTNPNIPLAQAICGMVARIYFAKSGNPDIKLQSGATVRHSHVFSLVAAINARSPTGKAELEIIDKVKGSGGYYIYKIIDYTLTATREKAEVRRPAAGGIPKTRLVKNRRTGITQGGESSLSRGAVYNSPAKMPKAWDDFDPSRYKRESGLSRLSLGPGESSSGLRDDTSSVVSLRSTSSDVVIGPPGSEVGFGAGLEGFGGGSGELSIDLSKKKDQ